VVREIWGDVGRYRGRRRHPRGLARGGQLILDQLGCVVVLAADGDRLAPLELAQLHAHRAELVDAHLDALCLVVLLRHHGALLVHGELLVRARARVGASARVRVRVRVRVRG